MSHQHCAVLYVTPALCSVLCHTSIAQFLGFIIPQKSNLKSLSYGYGIDGQKLEQKLKKSAEATLSKGFNVYTGHTSS